MFGRSEGRNGPWKSFPRAQVAISEVEYVHWRDHGDFGEARVPDEVARGIREVGKAFTTAISDRIVWLADGETIAPGLRAISAPGHTPGHTALHVHGTRHDLLLGGDFAGHEVLSLAYPSSHHAADYDGVQAVATRQRLLRDAEGGLVHGFHFGTPGIGRVEAAGRGWRYQPLEADRAGRWGERRAMGMPVPGDCQGSRSRGHHGSEQPGCARHGGAQSGWPASAARSR
jgi:glyoxylase-like metal-dependent hydrolase (beta-lactamase superfamily II)